MADTISYGGYTLFLSPSNTVIIDGGDSWARGGGPIALTYIDDLVPASFRSAASSPRVPEEEKAAVTALGNNVEAIKNLLKPKPTTPPPTPPQETAAATVANDSPDPANAATSGDTLSDSEQQNIKDAQTGANTEVAGTAVEPAAESNIDIETPEVLVTAKRIYETDIKPIPNILHQYANYTYGLSLHLLTAEEYNNLIKKQNFIPNRVLVASAGKYNNTPGPTQFIRAKYFANDFYFDKLQIETVIGMNERSRETNAVKIDFNLIEPYGFTFINRLIDLCNDPAINCNNYLDMPYMLQIDFYAMNDAGEIVGIVPDATKRIPIRLLKMDVKVGVKGAEYQFECSAYNHCAFDHSYADTPAGFEMQARTVAQFWQSTETQGDTTDLSSERESAVETKVTPTIVGPDGQLVPINPSLIGPKVLREARSVKSYGSAINDYNKDLFVKNKIGANDRYFFKFDPEIGNSPFTSDKILAPKDTGMANPNKPISIQKSNIGKNTDDYDPNLRIFQVNAGSTIDKMLADIICLSDFIQNQINIPDGENPEAYLRKKAETSDAPLYWFKIVPTVELKEFDKVRKVWARDITYYVQKYEIRNVKLKDLAPGGLVEFPVKEYNYIYTGKNVDVFDFDIQFNALYYNAMTFYRDALTEIYNTPEYTEELKSSNPDTYSGVDQNNNNIVPTVLKSQVIDARARANNGTITAKQVAVADLRQSLMSMYGADMMGLKLRIIGDPQYIKQDDIFYPPKIGSEDKTWDPRLVSAGGSLSMDEGEVYVMVKFRTPEDVDESTGLMQFGQYDSSLFSGMYKILTVVSEFAQGQFLQTLEMVRIPHQDKFDYSANSPKLTTQQRAPAELTATSQANQAAIEAPATDTTSGSPADNSDSGLSEIPPAEEEALPPLEDPNLANVAANAEEQPITDATEPQVAPSIVPKEVTATRELLSTQETSKSTEAAYEAAKAKYKVFEDQLNSSNPYQYIEDPAWRARAQAAQDELNAADEANKKARATYGASIQKLSVIRQGGI